MEKQCYVCGTWFFQSDYCELCQDCKDCVNCSIKTYCHKDKDYSNETK